MKFVKTDTSVLETSSVAEVDCARLDELIVTVTTKLGTKHVATNIVALELLMQLKPSMLEGRPKIKFPRFMWAVHNLIGHPVMQLLALFKLYDLAFYVHDATVPTPRVS